MTRYLTLAVLAVALAVPGFAQAHWPTAGYGRYGGVNIGIGRAYAPYYGGAYGYVAPVYNYVQPVDPAAAGLADPYAGDPAPVYNAAPYYGGTYGYYGSVPGYGYYGGTYGYGAGFPGYGAHYGARRGWWR